MLRRDGTFVPGATEDAAFNANVQSLKLEDADVAEGSRLSERLKCYIPEPDALVAAFEDRDADKVALADGRVFVVEASESWPNHTKAILLRET